MNLPFRLSYKIEKGQGFYTLTITDDLDKKAMSEEDWSTISSFPRSIDDYKKKFDLKVNENYAFDANDGKVVKIKITIIENTLSHDDSILSQDYELILTEK